MAGIFSFGGPQYDVDDAKIARNNGDGTFGTAYDLPSADLFSVGIRQKSAEMRGDARITAIAAQVEAVELQVRFGSFSAEVYEILFGGTASSSGVAPARAKNISVGASDRMPYWGICARSLAGETAGCTLLFLPYCKIMQNVSIRVEYNTFSMPEVNATSLGDPVLTSTQGTPLLFQFREYETAVAPTLPPAHVAGS